MLVNPQHLGGSRETQCWRVLVQTQGSAALVWAGVVGIATSILILAFSAGPNLLDVARIAGTALLAASLSIMFAAISAREAARQQYARDAHLQAKDKFYLPLNAQIARAHEELKRIEAGDAPYMQGGAP